MTTITTIGLDIAKSSLTLHGCDAKGAAVLKKTLKRARVLKFFAELPPCRVGITENYRNCRDMISITPLWCAAAAIRMRRCLSGGSRRTASLDVREIGIEAARRRAAPFDRR